MVSRCKNIPEDVLPFRATADPIFDNLSLFDRSHFLEELDQLFCAEARGKLLYENGSPVTLILSKLWFRCFGLYTLFGAFRTTAVFVTVASIIVITSRSSFGSVVAIIFGRPGSSTVMAFVTSGTSSVVIATATPPPTSVTAVSRAMFASGASHVIISVAVSISSVFPASVPSFAVFVSITGTIAVFVSVTTLTTVAAMAVIGFARRFFDIGGGCGLKESLDIES